MGYNPRGGYSNSRGGHGGERGAGGYGRDNARGSRAYYNYNYSKPKLTGDPAWREWAKVEVKLLGLPAQCIARDVFSLVKTKGNIERIQVKNEVTDAGLKCVAFVTFCPPPSTPFWSNGTIGDTAKGSPINAELITTTSAPTYDSPKDPKQKYPETMSTSATGLDFGFCDVQDDKELAPTFFTVMRSIPKLHADSIMLSVNLKFSELVISFEIDLATLGEDRPSRNVSATRTDGISSATSPSDRYKYSGTAQWRLVIPFKELGHIFVPESDPDFFHLIIPAKNPPKCYRKVGDPLTTMSDQDQHWSANRAWFRQTDILKMQVALELHRAPLNLHKDKPFVDLGAWTSYRITLPKHNFRGRSCSQMFAAMLDFNVEMFCLGLLDVRSGIDSKPHAWDVLDGTLDTATDRSTQIPHAHPRYGDMFDRHIHLDWAVRYQLEVCISNGLLNPYDISVDFLKQLRDLPERKSLRLLEHIADNNERIFHPMQVFSKRIPSKKKHRIRLPCILQRSATITPSQILYSSPTVEMSNRITRQYRGHEDRFLRVRFVDEKPEGKIYGRDDETHDPLFNRVRRCLVNGITVGGRHFEYLASGNSQFKEHGAYFFAPTPDLSTAIIREWMGDFRKLNVVAKYSSRMGQCYSTTRAISSSRVEIKELQDVKIAGSKLNVNFTDGIGMISPFLARIVAHELKIEGDTPSAFQFRLGGCKGVIAVSETAKQNEIHIRESQYKFPAVHEGLEIVRHAELGPAQLNRQLITNLCCLGVPTGVIVTRMQHELREIDAAIKNEKKAIALLEKRIDVNQMTTTIAQMLKSGLAKDPFVASILQLWRAWRHKVLKEKANITVTDGAFVIGCTDETKTLRGHFEENKSTDLPEIFLRIGDREHPGNYRVIEGTCCLMRNPSLHPGDVRIVKAVNIPELYHLKNVVVFPQTGDRDIPSMCSGGDLDGDDYYVAWDKDLLPKEWNYPPMQQPESAKPQTVDFVTMTDISNFHVKFMKQDSLGKIAMAWLALADHAVGGPKNPACIRLAQEHSTAVDFGKTGQPADSKVIREYGPKSYPHYMERKHKSYRSRTACGQIYDLVERLEFVPLIRNSFDQRILDFAGHNPLPESVMTALRLVKQDYDIHMRRIMRQWEIETEFEVWTAFILHHSKLAKAYEIQAEVGRLVERLISQFREACFEEAGRPGENHLEPLAAAMYKITAEQTTAYLREIDQRSDDDGPPKPCEMPLISFAWLCHRQLCKISSRGKLSGPIMAQTETPVASGLATPAPTILQPVKTPAGMTAAGDLLTLFNESDPSSTETLTPRKPARIGGDIAAPDPDDFLDYDDFYDAKEIQSPKKPSPDRQPQIAYQTALPASFENLETNPHMSWINPIAASGDELQHHHRHQKERSLSTSVSHTTRQMPAGSSIQHKNTVSESEHGDMDIEEDDESDSVKSIHNAGDALGRLSAVYGGGPSQVDGTGDRVSSDNRYNYKPNHEDSSTNSSATADASSSDSD